MCGFYLSAASNQARLLYTALRQSCSKQTNFASRGIASMVIKWRSTAHQRKKMPKIQKSKNLEKRGVELEGDIFPCNVVDQSDQWNNAGELQSSTGSKPSLMACSEGSFRCWRGQEFGILKNIQFSNLFWSTALNFAGGGGGGRGLTSAPRPPAGLVSVCPPVTLILDLPVVESPPPLLKPCTGQISRQRQ